MYTQHRNILKLNTTCIILLRYKSGLPISCDLFMLFMLCPCNINGLNQIAVACAIFRTCNKQFYCILQTLHLQYLFSYVIVHTCFTEKGVCIGEWILNTVNWHTYPHLQTSFTLQPFRLSYCFGWPGRWLLQTLRKALKPLDGFSPFKALWICIYL